MAKISKMTLCANNVTAIVGFYNAVLEAHFIPVSDDPAGFHKGQIADIPTLLCPNSIAQVDAKQNRQQFDFVVDDLENTVQAALEHGGTIIQAIEKQGSVDVASVYDPDGNSLVFIQQMD